MVLGNTSLFLSIDEAVHQLADQSTEYENNHFLIVVISQDAMPAADQIAKRLGMEIVFSAVEKNTETADSLHTISVVSFDYNMINGSGRDIPQDFICHQEQNLRANLSCIYAETYRSIASKFPGKVVILVDELTNNGDEFLPSMTKDLRQQPGRISLAVPRITPGIVCSNGRKDKKFVFLHVGYGDSMNDPYQDFDIIIEDVSTG